MALSGRQRLLLLLLVDDERVEAVRGERAALQALHAAPCDLERLVLVREIATIIVVATVGSELGPSRRMRSPLYFSHASR